MAITCVMGFDRVAPRIDGQIFNIEAFPFDWQGTASNLRVLADPVLGDRNVLRTYTSTLSNGFQTDTDRVFHNYKHIKTKWRLGYRFRCEVALGNITLSDAAGIAFMNEGNTQFLIRPIDSNELNHYVAYDRYVYIEITIDWEAGVIERHIDGYKLVDKDIPAGMQDLDRFGIVFTAARDGSTYCRWTDFYFQVDTSSLDGGTTPSDRLGGAFVRHLEVGEAALTEGWSKDEDALTPVETLNTLMTETTATRLYPHLITSVAENPMFTYFKPPLTGQGQRVGKGDILFLQTSLNAHRFDGSTAGLYATTVDREGNEHEERELQLFVDGYDGRAISYLNRTLKDETFTPINVADMGLRLYTRSGGA